MRVRKRNPMRKESLNEERPSFFKKNKAGDPQVAQAEFFKNSNIQTKIKFGRSGDPLEKQADVVADRVVASPGKTNLIQNKANDRPLIQSSEDSNERVRKFEVQKAEEEEAQTKLDLQKQEEEEAQTKLEIQKAEEEEAQTKMEIYKAEEEEAQPKFEIQKAEEEEAQTKLELQKQEEEEEEMLATKLEIQKQSDSQPDYTDLQAKKPSGNLTPSRLQERTFEEKIKSAKNGGYPLSDKIREEMERKMNGDFSRVRIHTDDEAIALCKSIKAQAFTTGFHIFFNKGKFQPNTSSGKHLLAHELTHVIQQKKILKKPVTPLKPK